MQLSLRRADPAGNITLFVRTPVPPSSYATIANALLSDPQFQAEQVGFQVPPQHGSAGRLQMMGGEFCGNATRSFGYLLAQESGFPSSTIQVEISGAKRPLTVSISPETESCITEMPLPQQVISLSFRGERFPAVQFDGILHTLVMDSPRSEAWLLDFLSEVQKAYPAEAYGVMFLEGETLIPVVYVTETRSLIWESSCGSGTTAVAVWRALQAGDGIHSYTLQQPNGSLTATVCCANGKVESCQMGGKITLSPEILWECPVRWNEL